jgi:hypothetical protein
MFHWHLHLVGHPCDIKGMFSHNVLMLHNLIPFFSRTLFTSGTFRASFGSEGDLSKTAARTQESQKSPSMDGRRRSLSKYNAGGGHENHKSVNQGAASCERHLFGHILSGAREPQYSMVCRRASFVTFSFRVFAFSLCRTVGPRVTVLVSNRGHGDTCFGGSRVLSTSLDVHRLAVGACTKHR